MSQKDICFEKNYAEAKKQKLPMGAYWYSYAKTKAEARKTVAELAQEVMAGKWGNGADRKKVLISAGYSYDDVQAEVNKIIGTQKNVTHTVRQGDTLSALSRRYGTTVMKIVADNKRAYPRISPNYIVVGWKLTIN